MLFLSFIFKNLWRQKTRSFLTALGISIGIAAVVTLFTLSHSLLSSYSEALESSGADLIVTQKNVSDLALSSIKEEYIDEIAKYKDVKESRGALYTFPKFGEAPYFILRGQEIGSRGLRIRIIKGREIFAQGEVIVGKIAAETHDLKIEDVMNFEPNIELLIVGIYEIGTALTDGGSITTLADAQKIAGREGRVTTVEVTLEPRADIDLIKAKIEKDFPDLIATRSSEFLETQSDIAMLDAFAWAFSVIAVIIGTIGVLNTMVMSVFERTREIGILKAVGWSKFKVMLLFLGESVILSVLGFGLGVWLGLGAICGIAKLPAVQGFISPTFDFQTFLWAAGVAILVGIVGGLYPAWRASRLSPLEALRYE